MIGTRLLAPAALAAALAAAACAGSAPAGAEGSGTVRVAAAADLRFALEALTDRFHALHPEVAIEPSYGSSGTFFAQLQRGAPFDLFLSADVAYPEQLEAQGLTGPGGTFEYAVGRLVLWVRRESPLDVERRGFDALLGPDVAHVAIANPEHAPYGRAAEAALRAAGVLDAVRGKLVLGENVSQALQFVQSGSADAGIVALSLALAPAMADEGRSWEVPLDLYPRVVQGGAVLGAAADPAAARTFADFMQADEGRAILRRFGFFMVEG